MKTFLFSPGIWSLMFCLSLVEWHWVWTVCVYVCVTLGCLSWFLTYANCSFAFRGGVGRSSHNPLTLDHSSRPLLALMFALFNTVTEGKQQLVLQTWIYILTWPDLWASARAFSLWAMWKESTGSVGRDCLKLWDLRTPSWSVCRNGACHQPLAHLDTLHQGFQNCGWSTSLIQVVWGMSALNIHIDI